MDDRHVILKWLDTPCPRCGKRCYTNGRHVWCESLPPYKPQATGCGYGHMPRVTLAEHEATVAETDDDSIPF